ncbi:MAG TPA: 16S rRNA (adenine(1518)-N(6)/adenine(1519)-N(6))-dimethyltransferase RsmA [Candidatus Acidoferrales bacterium]|jgi:16S rRNA (adenine1518-N6/adenine1519-N6)-dimethyltransferase|nr:16S rRNA (adenine(1518)-N(6)/adenine(1519)-N(6))-dimethyltransferase RsmA [Candidatus Acidoferrales bacterium]
MSRQPLGQHFLADVYWREEIARAIRVSPRSEVAAAAATQKGDFCWIEIGPGHGEMTEYLVGSGAAVHVIEVDQFLIGHLNRLKKKNPNLEVICADILETDLGAVANGKRMRIYGSLPYYITSPILHHLFQFAELIDEIHVVVQAEVAERMAAEPGSKAYGYLSVATQLNSRPELVLEIPRAAFTPPPEVGSTLATLRLPGGWEELRRSGWLSAENESAQCKMESEEDFLEFVKVCFSKKRKTLVNNLRELTEPEEVRKALGAIGLRPDARAEQISIPNFAALHAALRK